MSGPDDDVDEAIPFKAKPKGKITLTIFTIIISIVSTFSTLRLPNTNENNHDALKLY